MPYFELDFLKTKVALTIKGQDSGKSVTRPASWKFRVGLKLESVPIIVFGSFNIFCPIEYKRTKLLNKYTDKVFKVCVFEVCGLFRFRFSEFLFLCTIYNNYNINSITEITSIKKRKEI